MTYSILAVIPARSGSKRFPGKNLQLLQGKSLLAHAVDAARWVTTDIVVSVDSDEYADAAGRCGVQYVKRPLELSTDEARSIDVWKDAYLQYNMERSNSLEYTILLEPTCPLRIKSDLDRAIREAERYGSSATVSQVHIPPAKYIKVDYSRRFDLPKETRTQKHARHFVLNGAVYATTRKALFTEEMKSAFPVQIFRHLISIDEPEDLELCDALMTIQNRNQ